MKISQHVHSALLDWDAGRVESAMMHACAALDGTAARMFQSERKNSVRFKRCIRQFHWLIEPALAIGINLDTSRFKNVPLRNNLAPDFADVVYEIHRCAHAHGDEVPQEFELILCADNEFSWTMGEGVLQLPHRALFALLFVAVFAPVNSREAPLPGAYLSLGYGEGQDRFDLGTSWGKSADMVSVAKKHSFTRVEFEYERLPDAPPLAPHARLTFRVPEEVGEAACTWTLSTLEDETNLATD